MTDRSMHPVLVAGHPGSQRTEKQRFYAPLAGVFLDQDLVRWPGQNVGFNQNDFWNLRLMRDYFQPGERRATGQRQISQSRSLKVLLAEPKCQRASNQYHVRNGLLDISVQSQQRTVASGGGG